MKRITERALDSSQFYDGEAITGCVCCGIEYAGNGTHCLKCQAPLEVSRTILTSGTVSAAIQADTMAALEGRRFPEKTASEADGWQWVHCEVHPQKQRKDYMDIVTPDFAGEAVAMEVEQPGTYPAIQCVVAQSRGLLVLCDSMRGSEAPLNEDIFAMKLASYVYSLHDRDGKGKQRHKAKLPIAIVLTKCDQCPEAWQNPGKFAESNLPRLSQFCEHSFEHYRFFAASVVSGTATMLDGYGLRRQVPLHVEPRGVIEPLEWIMNQKV